VAGDERDVRQREFAVHQVEIGAAHAACRYLEDHLAWRSRGNGELESVYPTLPGPSHCHRQHDVQPGSLPSATGRRVCGRCDSQRAEIRLSLRNLPGGGALVRADHPAALQATVLATTSVRR
jgi:hypothetical protein